MIHLAYAYAYVCLFLCVHYVLPETEKEGAARGHLHKPSHCCALVSMLLFCLFLLRSPLAAFGGLLCVFLCAFSSSLLTTFQKRIVKGAKSMKLLV